MSLSLRVAVAALLVAACSGTSRPAGDNHPPPPPPPSTPLPVVPLTASTLREFINYAARSTGVDSEAIRTELGKAQSDVSVAHGLLAELSTDWDLSANGQQTFGDWGRALIILDIIKCLQSAAIVDDIHTRVWWPIPVTDQPGSPSGLTPAQLADGMESSAVEALNCMPAANVPSLVQEVAQSHPDQGVRGAATDALLYRYCLWGQDRTHPN